MQTTRPKCVFIPRVIIALDALVQQTCIQGEKKSLLIYGYRFNTLDPFFS
jgi:hypothetical protein